MAAAGTTVASVLGVALVLTGCGLDVTSPDLFVLKRTGQGRSVTMLVNDSGTIRCNGSPPRPLSDPLLLQARDLATSLDGDAKASLILPSARNSVYTYTITLQDGTIRFPDTAAGSHRELGQAELFAVQAAEGPCAAR